MSANRANEVREQLGYLTESGKKWLAIDIANTYGYDKLSFEDRLKESEDLFVSYKISEEEKLQSRKPDGLSYDEFLKRADSPWEFRNACDAYSLGEDQPVEHIMYLDCTNQALQLYAVTTSCKDTGYLCNISSGDERTDAYQVIADKMNQITGLSLFDRNSCKKALMTTLYGKMDGESEIIKYFLENKIDYLPMITDEDIGKVFQQAMRDVAPHAMRAMDMLQELNDENIDTYYWTMPDGFKVKYDVKSSQKIDIKCTTKGGINFNFDKSVSVYKGSKFNRGIAPNVIHSIDAYVGREMVRRMTNPNLKSNRSYPAFITPIHDAFATHPNNVEEMKSHYTDIMVELNESNILQDIMSQIIGKPMLSIKKNTLTEEDIRSSIYSLS